MEEVAKLHDNGERGGKKSPLTSETGTYKDLNVISVFFFFFPFQNNFNQDFLQWRRVRFLKKDDTEVTNVQP